MAGRILVERLAIESFRNIEALSFDPAPRLNLVWGDNGHGKTSLVEALYVVCTTRSFRSSRLGETIRSGSERARVLLRTRTLGLSREQRAAYSARGRSFSVDGKRQKRSVDYALKTPVIAFHPGDLTLVSGPATPRRTLLDRMAVYLDPPGAEARLAYQKAVRGRLGLLSSKGPHARELDAYESVIARHGVVFARARARVAERLTEAVLPAFERMAAPGLEPTLEFRPGGTADYEEFLRTLAERRVRDHQRGAATFGPHRDELHLSLSGRPARSHASQGQQRLLALSLKLAELSCVREATGLEPILLLDDVSSELDPERTQAVFELLGETQSQVFVTTTRPELFDRVLAGSDQRLDLHVRGGRSVP